MADASRFIRPLQTVVTIKLQRKLVRRVRYEALASVNPPNFLYTSGKPNRYNPPGLECIYFSEDDGTAAVEFRRDLAGLPDEFQPVVTYWAEVMIQRALDLTDLTTVRGLGLDENELFAPWRGSKQPTLTQTLGDTLVKHTHITAIRFPSDAAKLAGLTGNNVVVYRAQVKPPDRVSIVGPTGRKLQTWP